MNFGTAFEPIETNHYMGGVQHKFAFPNGYGASVIRHRGSYGFEEGLWELAVLAGDSISYDTPLTDDVLGRLSEDEVGAALTTIQSLPKAGA